VSDIAFTIPGVPVAKVESAIQRFFSKIRIEGGCWAWTGALDRKGYARFRDSRGKKVFVHRFSYEKYVGQISEGMTIDHLCRNRACCNPGHLEMVTNTENIRRGTQGQYQTAKTHCPKGHEYSPENTYISPKGGRFCRICKREIGRRCDQNRPRRGKK
jgi:hypothetical protein